MESNERFYARRAVEELRALERALTPEGKARRRALAEAFSQGATMRPGDADEAAGSDGEPCWVRTSDLLIKSQLLYRLS